MIVQDKAGLDQMVGSLRRANFLAFDIESTGFDPYTENLVMLQFWDGEGEVYIVDARIASSSPRKAKFLGEILKPVFDEAGCIVGHNLKFDLAWMQHHLGIELSKLNIWDTMISEQYVRGLGLSDAMKQGVSFSLKDTAKRYDAGVMSKEERNWFIHLNSRDEWGKPFPPEQVEYAEKDVRVLKTIYEAQQRTIEARGMGQAMQDEMGALIALVQCELNGINLNVEEWRAFIKEKEAEAEGYYNQVFEVFAPAIQAARLKKFDEGMEAYRAWDQAKSEQLDVLKYNWDHFGNQLVQVEEVKGWGDYKNRCMKAWREANPNPGKPKLSTDPPNLGSPVQLLDALHARGIEVKSAGVEVLEPLKDQHPEIALLLQWRKSIKFSQSFGESLLEKINPVTGRLHPTFHQIGASSGRMSCTNPNFQQIPSKGDGAKIRACVVAPPGSKLIVADYSAQELRVLADLSGDERLLWFFENEANLKDDIHEATARVMFGVPEDQDVPKSLRSPAKTINYGVVYGMSSFALAGRIKETPERAEELMDAWFKTYPGVKPWLAERAKYTQHHRTSPTATGWVRRFAYHSPEPTKPGRGEPSAAWGNYFNAVQDYRKAMSRLARQGMNTPIQGAAAGITKKALAYLIRGCYNGAEVLGSGQETRFKILAVVHDEIVLEAKEEDAEAAAEYLADCMDAACKAVLKRVHVPRTEVVISDHWTH